ncbi:MAG: hypothetical protein CSA45_00455 [Gammaproteobacteria bacterium]|nr:MAG: hypothetical protein CSA45_00455 [Gammaproteobacteria bacterium]
MKERIVTALIMIAVVLGIIFYLPILFNPLVAIILGVATWEWSRMCQLRRINSYLMTAATILLWVISTYYSFVFNVLLIIALLNYLYTIHFIWQYERVRQYRIHRTYLRVCGPIILAALASTLLYVFNFNPGQEIASPEDVASLRLEDAMSLTFIVMVIAAADTGAYFVGRLSGKHQLSPKASPNKTIEGLIGGLLAVVLIVSLFGWMVEGWYLAYWQLLIISLIAAIFSVVGDLFISVIKRQNHLKDSSQILPGHGGILDRIDGMMAGIPVFYLMQQYLCY